MFFGRVNKNTWKLLTDYPTFELQDPYYSFIGDKLILDRTEIFEYSKNPGKQWCRTKKQVGKEIYLQLRSLSI